MSKIHILIASQVFPPEGHPTAVMMGELARFLTAQGHDVTVAVGYPHHPHGRLPDGYQKRLWTVVESHDGVRVRRSWHITSPDMRIPVRAVVMVSQTLAIVASGLGARSADVVLSVGPPLVGPLLSALLALRSRAPLVSVIYDIYPDVAIESRKLSNPGLVYVARHLERLAYKYSDAIIVLSEGFRSTLEERGVPLNKIRVVPVWLDGGEIRPLPRENEWRREQRISPEKFVVLYAGTMGLVCGAQVIVQAAEILRDDPRILFLFVGEGRIRDELMSSASDLRLDNVTFLPFQPRPRVAEVQATADVSLVTLLSGKGRTSVPSKVLAYLAAGRPVVASVDECCDTAELVRGSGAGIVVPPENPAALARAIGDLAEDTDRCRALGAAARSAFERSFTREQVLSRFQDVLLHAVQERKSKH